MKYLITSVAAIALLTGCGGKDKDGNAGTSVSQSSGKVSAVELRKGDAATADQALAAFSMSESGAGRVDFSNADVKGTKATFSNVVITPTDDEDGTIKAGKLVFDGLGMMDGQANFASLVMSDITISPPDGEDVDAGGKVKSVELINPSPETAAWVASLLGKGEPAELPTGKALAFDKWAVNDLTFSINEDDGAQGQFLIEKVEVNNLADEKAERFLISDVKMDMVEEDDDTDVKAKIGKIEVRGIDLGMMTAMSEHAGNQDAMAEAIMSTMNRDVADPGYDAVAFDDIDFAVSGANFVLPKLRSDVKRDKQGRAVEVKTDKFNMTLSTSEGELGEQLAGGLAMMGYEKAELSGEGHTKYDPDKDIITYVKGKNYYALKDGFRFDMSGKFEGIQAITQALGGTGLTTGGMGESDFMQSALETMVVHGFEISFDDDGFLDKGFNAYAAMNGEDPAQMKSQMAGMMAMAPMMAAQSGVDAQLATEVASAVADFINDPKTLTISLNPPAPLQVKELSKMQDPSMLTKEYLGLSASNK